LKRELTEMAAPCQSNIVSPFVFFLMIVFIFLLFFVYITTISFRIVSAMNDVEGPETETEEFKKGKSMMNLCGWIGIISIIITLLGGAYILYVSKKHPAGTANTVSPKLIKGFFVLLVLASIGCFIVGGMIGAPSILKVVSDDLNMERATLMAKQLQVITIIVAILAIIAIIIYIFYRDVQVREISERDEAEQNYKMALHDYETQDSIYEKAQKTFDKQREDASPELIKTAIREFNKLEKYKKELENVGKENSKLLTDGEKKNIAIKLEEFRRHQIEYGSTKSTLGVMVAKAKSEKEKEQKKKDAEKEAKKMDSSSGEEIELGSVSSSKKSDDGSDSD